MEAVDGGGACRSQKPEVGMLPTQPNPTQRNLTNRLSLHSLHSPCGSVAKSLRISLAKCKVQLLSSSAPQLLKLPKRKGKKKDGWMENGSEPPSLPWRTSERTHWPRQRPATPQTGPPVTSASPSRRLIVHTSLVFLPKFPTTTTTTSSIIRHAEKGEGHESMRDDDIGGYLEPQRKPTEIAMFPISAQ